MSQPHSQKAVEKSSFIPVTQLLPAHQWLAGKITLADDSLKQVGVCIVSYLIRSFCFGQS
jgi:hypothetical protein